MSQATIHQAKIIVSYHNIVLAGRSQYEGGQTAEFEVDAENLVGVVQGAGLAMFTRSDWGPVEFTLELAAGGGGATEPANVKRQSEVEFTDDEIYVGSFDQFPEELLFLPLPRGAGKYSVLVEWRYTPRAAPDDVELPGGELTPEQQENPAFEDFWESITVRLR